MTHEPAQQELRADLIEVEPFHDDILEKGYRCCDLCHESCCEDIWANRPWRKFYFCKDEGLNVCGNCLDEFLKELP